MHRHEVLSMDKLWLDMKVNWAIKLVSEAEVNSAFNMIALSNFKAFYDNNGEELDQLPTEEDIATKDHYVLFTLNGQKFTLGSDKSLLKRRYLKLTKTFLR